MPATPKRWQNPDGTPMDCKVPGCRVSVTVKGFCGSHYYHQRKDPDVLVQRGWFDQDGNRLSCMQLNCDKPIEARGMCSLHYRRNLSNRPKGESRDSRRKWFNEDGSRKTCTTAGCDNPVHVRGVCSTHYDRDHKRRFGLSAKPAVFCPVAGCGRKKAQGSVICGRCRQARWRYGLSDETFMEMMKPNNRRCANPGCGSVERLHVDHDHSCCPPGKFVQSSKVSCGECVRGWLCRSCNTSLGLMQESPERIRGLLTYLGAS